MNLSRPFSQFMGDSRETSRAPESPSLRVADGRQLDTDSLDVDMQSAPTATLQEPFDQPKLQLANGKMEPNAMTNSKHSDQQTLGSSLSSDRSSSMQTAPPKKFAKKTRYYAHALSNEDKQALAVGEMNHNLKEWTARDLVNHHEARKSLVPRGMAKLQDTNALAGLEEDRQRSQRALPKFASKVRHYTKLPWIKVTFEEPEKIESAYTPPQHGSRSMGDLGSASAAAPVPQLLSPTLLSPLILADHPALEQRASHTCAANSTGDYFTFPPRPSSSHPSSSGHNSGTSSRVRSPLSNEFLAFQPNPQITFDAFLAPHKLGKGETHRDSENAKKEKKTKEEKWVGSPKRFRRLSKMPSMPSLRKRNPKGGAEEGDKS
ncbi:Nn.00g091760.m01.CDS01 [Neocucurbitaria sp. VM-36]